MKLSLQTQPVVWPTLAWTTVAMAGFALPFAALVMLANMASAETLNTVTAPIVAVAMMGAAMIGAATAGRFWLGVGFGLVTGAALVFVSASLGLPGVQKPVALAIVCSAASVSFAARGALFARSGLDKGWWIAVFVVAGEAAVLATAAAQPGALPDWLLVLLPAQWASLALQSGFDGSNTVTASAALAALLGTGAATLFVVKLWPRRWPYLVMFSAWLSFAALVWNYSTL